MRPLHTCGSSLAPPWVLAALTLLYMAPVFQAPSAQYVLDGHDLLNRQYPLYAFIFASVREGRGVCVSAGQHRVTFDCTPRLFFDGLIISVLGWVVTGGLPLWRR